MCGLFGFIGRNVNRPLLLSVATEASRRGPHAVGIAYRTGAGVIVEKQRGTQNIDTLISTIPPTLAIIGNCRLSTSGTHTDERNNQPLTQNGIAISHNGNITNADALAHEMNITLNTKCDSEIILHLIAVHGIDETLRILTRNHSPFALLIMRGRTLYATSRGQPLYRLSGADGVYFCSRPFYGAELIGDATISIRL